MDPDTPWSPTPDTPWSPTREQIAEATGQRIPDVLAPRLRVLFVGINPGLRSAAVGHHFAGVSNRFWKALHLSGLTPRRLSPFEDRALPSYGLGLTNLVGRATRAASELSPAELRRGRARLEGKIRRCRPAVVAFLGMDAYRAAFETPRPALGRQPGSLGGARVWLLPNPSGLNARYQLADLVTMFRTLARDSERTPAPAGPAGTRRPRTPGRRRRPTPRA